MTTAVIRALPPRDAIAALMARGGRLTATFGWQDLWEAEHAHAFTVAKSAGYDILAEIHAALVKAMQEGRTIEQFAADLRPLLESKGWWGWNEVVDPLTGERRAVQLGSLRRLRNIFETNMRVSYAAGHWAMFERNKAARPFLRYVAIMDDRVRPHHARLHNLVLPVDHPFWNEWAPPNGWGCRCTLQQLSQREVDRLVAEGEVLQLEPPTITARPWTNRRTGEVVYVPDGIDPGWSYNPGKEGHRSAALADKLQAGPPGLAAAAVQAQSWPRQALADEFAAWVDAIDAGRPVDRSMFTVGALSQDLLDALAARDIRPQGGAITVHQAALGHALRDVKTQLGTAAPIEALRRLPATLREATAVLRDRRDGALVYVFDTGGDRRGKLIVRLDFSERVREPGGRRQQIVSNSFRTAGVVSVDDLSAPSAYELLIGRL